MDRFKHESEDETFGDHLEVLRRHLIRMAVALIVLSIVAFIYKDFIFDEVLLAPRDAAFVTNDLLCRASKTMLGGDVLCINQTGFLLMNIELPGQFRAHLWVSFIAGLMLGFPYFIWEIWRFVKPALSPREKKNTNGLLFFTSSLFTIGVLFGYYLIAPLTVNFLSNYQVSYQLENHITFQSYISIIVNITLATGLVFELPVLVYFLSKIGILTPYIMRKYRKHAVVAVFIISGIITPPDIFSQVLVSLPLYLLYELSITISSRIYKKQKKAGLVVSEV